MNVVENPVYCDFLITPNCNFGCEFCSASSNNKKQKTHQLSLDSITKALHELDELDVLRVSFEGGEPFLRKDIFEILSVADELNFLYYINTNGSLINESIAEKLSKTNVNQVCISIDGPNAEIHDQCRGYRGAFDKMKKAISLLKKHEVPIQAIITLTSVNYSSLYKTLQFINEQGIKAASIMLLASVGSANTDYIVPFDKWAKLLIKLSIDKLNGDLPINVRIVSTGESNHPWEIYLPLLNNDRPELLSAWVDENTIEPFSEDSFGCTAGKTSMAIDGYGNVYGCSLMVSIPEFKAGNILEDSLQDIWERSNMFKTLRDTGLSDIEGACKSCNLLIKCKGGCRACAQATTGSIFGSDLRCENTRGEIII